MGVKKKPDTFTSSADISSNQFWNRLKQSFESFQTTDERWDERFTIGSTLFKVSFEVDDQDQLHILVRKRVIN